ncbi:MAG: apolipoprotein N-acyltransferase [Mailhella sp.]|nr:apolipoprotein N-acyltransferase [Mailhella sp.]
MDTSSSKDMNGSGHIKPSAKAAALAAAAGAIGIFLGQANPMWQMPFFALLYPAALFCLARLRLAPFRLGTLTGAAGSAASLYWIFVAAHEYGGVPLVPAVLCPAALGLYVGLWGGLFAWILAKFETPGPRAGHVIAASGGLRSVLSASLVWYLLEAARGSVFTGFPWLTLSAAFVPLPAYTQAAAVTGAYGLSALLAAGAFFIVSALLPSSGTRLRPLPSLACGLCLLAFLPAAGAMRIYASAAADSFITVSLVQGNIRQDVKWDLEFRKNTLLKYLELSEKAVRIRRDVQVAMPAALNDPLMRMEASGSVLPDLIIWPETALPFFYQEDTAFSAAVDAFADSSGIPLLFGAPAFSDADPDILHNRAYLRENRQMSWYDKHHLVPFGEYVPAFADLPFLRGFTAAVGGYAPGSDPGILRIGSKNVLLGPLICYEAIFPELARERAAMGAHLFVIMSNDAWYNKTSAAKQHLHLASLRCVEQHRAAARCTNTGISAFIDPLGGIHSETPLFEEAVVTSNLPLEDDHTVFFFIQPYLTLAALILLALAVCRKDFLRRAVRKIDKTPGPA